MIRPIFNLMLAAGYLLGTVLVWIGVEMFAIDGARLAPSLMSVILGIAVWWILASFGRRIRSKTTGAAECSQ